MDPEEALRKFKEERISLSDTLHSLNAHSLEKLEFAILDVGRKSRAGVPEVILGEGKTPAQVALIAKSLESTIISRVRQEHVDALKKAGVKHRYFKEARMIVTNPKKCKKKGTVAVITGGTSDIPVAEEAAITAEQVGCNVKKAYDVGVAGLHRLISALKKIGEVDVFIVVAGREGTLPGVVAGLVDKPVIGVPTSIGYGYGGKGEAALKAMLQSCSFITVVNIDNGVGAGACAALIARSKYCQG